MRRKRLGAKGEDLAFSFLKKKGYRFIDRNFSCPLGEIDLIFRDNDSLVFVEVKTRWSRKYGKPQEAVTHRKLKSISKTALWFKKSHPRLPEKLRIDVIAIEVYEDGALKSLKHLKNVTA